MKVHDKYTVLAADEVWYHGRTVNNKTFSLDHTGKGNDQEGPGFYFTTDLKDARGYAHPNGIVMKVTLKPRKLVEGKANRRELEKLMNMAPDLEDTLTDWDESPVRAKKMALDGAMQRAETAKDGFQQIWYDFYRNEPKTYLQNMVKMGYDGHLATWLTSGVKHLIVYNPDIIHVEEVIPYSDA